MIKLPNRNFTLRIMLGLVTALVIVYFYPHRSASHYIYDEGRPWNYAKLIAPFDIPIHPDSATLRNARDTLDRTFVPVYEINQLLIDTIARQLPPSHGENLQSRLSTILRRCYAPGVVDAATYERIVCGELPKVRILEKNVLSEMSTAHFTTPARIYASLDSTITDPTMRQYIAKASLNELLRPNVVFNEAESERHYNYDYLTLTADRGVIQQGQTIVDKGTVLSSQDFTNLQTYERMLNDRITSDSKSDWLIMLGQLLYVALLLGALIGYTLLCLKGPGSDLRSLTLIMSLLVLFFLLVTVATHLGTLPIYAVPVAIVPIIIMVFFNANLALISFTVLTLICAPISAYCLEFVCLQFVAGCTAVLSLRKLNQRMQLLRTACFVAVAYIVTYTALELLLNGTFETFDWHMAVILLLNGLLVSMTYILMLVVERVFGFTSEVTLVELADINNPLLRKLNDECPGTFQHSMAVSNLAADAAQRIGADVNLVRTAALYHDIGKMSNPAFFTENQHGVNPHDALPPEKSAEIVIRHVTDGLRRAERARLPQEIKDAISQHHGQGKAKYFYYNWIKQHPDCPADDAAFTYPGPNPRSREMSVLMMADAVEAASRSLTDHSIAAITDLVNRIIDGQIAEGLHDDSLLAYRDVTTIKEAFIKRLSNIYHSRVAYPTGPKPTETAPSSPSEQ